MMEKLSGMDASFLHLDTEHVQMHVSFLAFLEPDPSISFERLNRELARRVSAIPALTRKLAPIPLDIHHPAWIVDAEFDPIHHLRAVSLSADTSEHDLAELLARINARPIDRSRPLWELWVIEGIEGGRLGLFLKLHHALADGVSGSRLFTTLFDGPPAELSDEVGVVFKNPEKLTLIREGLAARLRQPLEVFSVLKRAGRGLRAIVSKRQDPSWEEGGTPMVCPRTPFNAAVGSERSAALAVCSLSELREIRSSFGVTVNDVLLALASTSLRDYLNERGALPEESLLSVCPVSIREADQSDEVNNRVSAMFARLYTDRDDPVERLKAIHRGTRAAKWEHQTFGRENLSGLAELTSVSTLGVIAKLYTKTRMASRHRPFHNLVISNIPGPKETLSFMGMRAESMHAMGPVMEGAGLNITVLSSGDTLGICFHADADLVPGLRHLPGHFEDALEELLREARLERTLVAALDSVADAERNEKSRGAAVLSADPV